MTLYHFACSSVRVTQLTSDSLPLLSVLYISPTEIVAAVTMPRSMCLSV